MNKVHKDTHRVGLEVFEDWDGNNKYDSNYSYFKKQKQK